MKGIKFSYGEVTYKGRTATLTRKQYAIVQALVKAAPDGLTTERLFQVVYHERRAPLPYEKDLIRVHIKNIRQRLAVLPLVLESRHGFGYRIRLQ